VNRWYSHHWQWMEETGITLGCHLGGWWIELKSFYQVVGLSCEGYEDKLLALFEMMEVARDLSIAESKNIYPSTLEAKG
jgi:hypothetical protein